MTEFDEVIKNLPPGHKAELAFVSFWKRELLVSKLSVAERLRILEVIAASARGPVPLTAVAVIEPATDALATVITEAIRAAAGSEDGTPCFDILERSFESLMALHPSIREAVALCRCR